jgi:hypothetical protein
MGAGVTTTPNATSSTNSGSTLASTTLSVATTPNALSGELDSELVRLQHQIEVVRKRFVASANSTVVLSPIGGLTIDSKHSASRATTMTMTTNKPVVLSPFKKRTTNKHSPSAGSKSSPNRRPPSESGAWR